MMSDKSDDGVVKLVDFGLSKFVGPNCTANDLYGTIGYIAPEVLKKQPYGFSCDMWGLGCIIYALFCGCLPFDSDKQNEAIRMTLHDSLEFDSPCWLSASSEAKDLIFKLLLKDPNQRMTMQSLFEHEWITQIKLSH